MSKLFEEFQTYFTHHGNVHFLPNERKMKYHFQIVKIKSFTRSSFQTSSELHGKEEKLDKLKQNKNYQRLEFALGCE